MPIYSQLRDFSVVTVAAVSLASCSGGASPSAVPNAQAATLGTVSRLAQVDVTRAGTGSGVVFPRLPLPQFVPPSRQPFVDVAGINAPGGNQTIVADGPENLVRIYGALGHLNALIYTNLENPQGVATDAAENLYVANFFFQEILIYKKPYTGVPLSLNDANEYPEGVAVSTTGMVGVTNLISPTGGFGGASLYRKGSAIPCVTNLGTPYLARGFFGAFDAAGNFFIDGQDPLGNMFIGEVSGGCKATRIKRLSTRNTIGAPGNIQVVDGQILIADQVNRAIYTYGLPSGSSLGAPTSTLTLPPTTDPVGFAVRQWDHRVWVADATFTANVTEYTYPAGAVLQSAYGGIQIVGVAVNPVAAP